MSNESKPQPKRSLSRLYNASQLRVDTWSRLRYAAADLARRDGPRGNAGKLAERIRADLEMLEPIETYWAFPGMPTFRHLRRLLESDDYTGFSRIVSRIVRALVSNSYRRRAVALAGRGEGRNAEEEIERMPEADQEEEPASARPYFEVLVADALTDGEEDRIRTGLREIRRPEDRFSYEIVVAPSFEDALIAVLFNPTIQCCLIHDGLPLESRQELGLLEQYLERVGLLELVDEDGVAEGAQLARLIGCLRPELDCFLVTDMSIEDIAGRLPRNVSRVFYRKEDFLELHLNILRGVNERYKTPFFNALKEYSVQPTGVFHAMPISRGKSIAKSHWIQDMAQFYGMNIFLAETSATSGGLDSLLDPQGPIKKAQELAARAFGAQRTYFVTNGTSTANKIVLQAVIQPGDIVLVDRNCHKSHHYGFVLSGAQVCYLNSYPLHDYSMYGAVPLREIKATLLAYKRAGTLDRVKMLLLTNCTFDGLVYNVDRIMEECLAIKPDLVFLWDEAWFAFARFDPVYRQRTAMEVTRVLRERYRSDEYRERYARFRSDFGDPDPEGDEAAWLNTHLLPDPDRVRLRVYSTQSTHKTLSALRQGSMIHVHDQDFARKTGDAFDEAYMTHTSTSPNYQVVASLDLARRQVELEGFELVQKQKEMAMALRERVTSHPLLREHFSFLTVKDMIPSEYRESGLERYFDEQHGWSGMMDSWSRDEFVLDPCRLTLFIGRTGVDGNTFKNEHLMQRHGIQINKTSRNTVLFMTNIGTTRSSVAYLIEVLVKIAHEIEEAKENSNAVELKNLERRVAGLTRDLPPLPDFSRFHDVFRSDGTGDTMEGDIRAAFFLAAEQDSCVYVRLDDQTLDDAIARGEEPVSAKFIIPYPPGFPVLVPGQVISGEIVEFMRKLDVKEIHGYQPELGLRVFSEQALAGRGRAGARSAAKPAVR